MISGIHLQPELKKVFLELGFEEMTDIQKKTIPLIQQGKDVIGQSQTGSGKTVAFGFPMLEKVVHKNGLQALVLVPTRELCEQVTSELRKFSRDSRRNIISVYGGVSIMPQIEHLRNADIVVGTPGRILDHLQRGTINFSKVRMLVLDEADKMFEMGFIDDVKRIISQIPKDRQTLLFSATISSKVHEIVAGHMRHPVSIKVQSYVDKGKMAQYYYEVNSRDKFSLLAHMLKHESPKLAIIFCATRRRVDIVNNNLVKNGIRSIALHGGLSQNQRKRSIDMFHRNEVNVLAASDVAARGLDIKNVSHVINYDIPKTSKEYIHRIGRTARAGMEGKVISLLSEEDHENFRSVLGDRSIAIEKIQLPQFERLPFAAAVRESHSRFGERRGGSYSRGGSYGHRGGGYDRRPYHPRQRESSSEEGSYGHRQGNEERKPYSGQRESGSGGSSGYRGHFQRSHRRFRQ